MGSQPHAKVLHAMMVCKCVDVTATEGQLQPVLRLRIGTPKKNFVKQLRPADWPCIPALSQVQHALCSP
jgi:hypothetical protein